MEKINEDIVPLSHSYKLTNRKSLKNKKKPRKVQFQKSKKDNYNLKNNKIEKIKLKSMRNHRVTQYKSKLNLGTDNMSGIPYNSMKQNEYGYKNVNNKLQYGGYIEAALEGEIAKHEIILNALSRIDKLTAEGNGIVWVDIQNYIREVRTIFEEFNKIKQEDRNDDNVGKFLDKIIRFYNTNIDIINKLEKLLGDTVRINTNSIIAEEAQGDTSQSRRRPSIISEGEDDEKGDDPPPKRLQSNPDTEVVEEDTRLSVPDLIDPGFVGGTENDIKEKRNLHDAIVREISTNIYQLSDRFKIFIQSNNYKSIYSSSDIEACLFRDGIFKSFSAPNTLNRGGIFCPNIQYRPNKELTLDETDNMKEIKFEFYIIICKAIEKFLIDEVINAGTIKIQTFIYIYKCIYLLGSKDLTDKDRMKGFNDMLSETIYFYNSYFYGDFRKDVPPDNIKRGNSLNFNTAQNYRIFKGSDLPPYEHYGESSYTNPIIMNNDITDKVFNKIYNEERVTEAKGVYDEYIKKAQTISIPNVETTVPKEELTETTEEPKVSRALAHKAKQFGNYVGSKFRGTNDTGTSKPAGTSNPVGTSKKMPILETFGSRNRRN